MKFQDASHHALRAQERLLRAVRKGEVLARKAERDPGRMAKHAMAKGADRLLATPVTLLAKAAAAGTMQLAKTSAWAMGGAFRGAVAGSVGVAHALDGLRRFDVHEAKAMSEKPLATVYHDTVRTLEEGLGYALARADYLTNHPPSIELDVGQYLKLSGIIAAEKIPKMLLMSAAIHSLGLAPTAVGHLLAPAIEEQMLHAAHLGNAAVQTGVGVGLMQALHSPMAEALRKSNIVQKDEELKHYTAALHQARADLNTITKALSAVQNLHALSGSPESGRVRKSSLHAVEDGITAAGHAIHSATQSDVLTNRDPDLQRGFLQTAKDFVVSLGIEASDVPAVAQQLVATAQARVSSASDAASSRSSSIFDHLTSSTETLVDAQARVTSLKQKRQQLKDLNASDKRLDGLRKRLASLEELLSARKDDGALQSDISRLNLRIVAELARREHQQSGRQSTQKKLEAAELDLVAERLAMRHAASALDAGLAKNMAGRYLDRADHYSARYEAQKARFDRKRARLVDKLDGKVDDLADEKLAAQVRRYDLKLNIIAHKLQLASLDATFAEHLGERGARPNDAESLANRRTYLSVQQQLDRDRALALTESDKQKRQSVYLRLEAPAAAPGASAPPALVRGIANAGRFVFGVIPGLNLPWWSVRWGNRQLAARRLETMVRRVTAAEGGSAPSVSDSTSLSLSPAMASSGLSPRSREASDASDMSSIDSI